MPPMPDLRTMPDPFLLAATLAPRATCRQIALLRAIAAAPGLSSGVHARSTGMSNPAITRATDRLQALGLARRAPDPKDRRKLRIYVTTAGGALAAQLGAMGA